MVNVSAILLLTVGITSAQLFPGGVPLGPGGPVGGPLGPGPVGGPIGPVGPGPVGGPIGVVGPVGGAPGYGYYGRNDLYSYPKYQYNYGVSSKVTGDFKTAHETRDGPLTKGSYSFLQPDGILRTVNYVVDPIGGFQAQVLNKGIAHHVPFGRGFGYYG